MGYRPLDADTMSYVTLKIKQFVAEVPEILLHSSSRWCAQEITLLNTKQFVSRSNEQETEI